MAEQSFVDSNGIPVEEFDVLEVFHFIGGRRRHYYMYKWVRERDGHLVAMHLSSREPDNYVDLRSISKDGKLLRCEIIQSPNWEKLK